MVVEHEHFGQVFEVRYERMDREFAELLTEGHVLLGRHLGVAKEQHLVVHQGLMNSLCRGIADRLGEVDAAHFGNERGTVGDDLNHERVLAAARPASSTMPMRMPRAFACPCGVRGWRRIRWAADAFGPVIQAVAQIGDGACSAGIGAAVVEFVWVVVEIERHRRVAVEGHQLPAIGDDHLHLRAVDRRPRIPRTPLIA